MSNNRKLLCETMYFGPIPFFMELLKVDTIILEHCEHYNKSSYRNRLEIATSNGRLNLSIPLLKGKHQGQLIRDVQIDNSYSWQSQHWKSIQTAYRKSPYFDFYDYFFSPLFESSTPYHFLWDFNLACFEKVIHCLSISAKIETTHSYQADIPTGIRDLRHRILPRNIHQYPHTAYQQTFEDRTGFIPNLSILDLLFCKGPESLLHLKHMH